MKILKSAVLYIERDGTQYQCKDCKHYDNGQCAIVIGDIDPLASCGYWVDREGELTKAEAGYATNRAGFSCKRCIHFNGKDACEVVAGIISPDGCCSGWTSSSRTGTKVFGK